METKELAMKIFVIFLVIFVVRAEGTALQSAIKFINSAKERDFSTLYTMMHPELRKYVTEKEFIKMHPIEWSLEHIEIENSYSLVGGNVIVLRCTEINGGRKNEQAKILFLEVVGDDFYWINYPFVFVNYPNLWMYIRSPELDIGLEKRK